MRPPAVPKPLPPITNSAAPTLPQPSAPVNGGALAQLVTKAKSGRTPFVLGMLAAGAMGVLGLALTGGRREPPPVAAPVVAPVAPAVPAAPVEQTSVLVSLHSTPPGAMVFVGDKEYGPTPTQVEWTGPEAALGREVTLRFVRRGYQELTVTRQIRGPVLEIEAPKLDLAEPEPANALKPKPARALP
jgi:serine/threonine-protein kinase